MSLLLLANLDQTLNNFFGNTWYLILLNGFGILAIMCKICEYQVKKRNVMLAISSVANFLWVLYFIFYGDLASALTCFIGVIRLLIFMQRGKYRWAEGNIWLYVFLVLQVIVAIFTFASWKSIISLTAGFVGIFAYFVIKPTKYRVLSFFHMAIWVVNSIINFYPIALVSDCMSLTSVSVAICRFDIIGKKKKENTTTK